MAVTMSPGLAKILGKKADPDPASVPAKGWPAKPVAPVKPQTDYMQHLGAKKVAGQQVVGTIEVTKNVNVVHADGSSDKSVIESSEQEVVHPALTAPEHPCVVSIHGSRTINLGNYNSVKIGVTLSMPCDKDNINGTYDFVSDWVSEKLTAAAKANGA